MNETKEYDFKEHRHRFSIWTAASAVQRSFATTSIISSVINKTPLRDFAESNPIISQQTFDEQHKLWCQTIIEEFKLQNITASYGRAAKIVAIYLKTSLVISSSPDSEIVKVIHPPIDSILLKSLSKTIGFAAFKTTRWTKLEETGYWYLVTTIREQVGTFDWRLESHWKPELDD